MFLMLRLAFCFILLFSFVGLDCLFAEVAVKSKTVSAKTDPRKSKIPSRKTVHKSQLPASADGGDSPWKRGARQQALRMRALAAPEALYWISSIDTSSEVGSRQALGFAMQFTENWEFTVFDRLSFFALKTGGRSAGRQSLELRVSRAPGNAFRPWFSLSPYCNFHEGRGARPSLASGFVKGRKNGASVEAEAFAWQPWDEGYYTILEDGERFGGALGLSLPFGEVLVLNARGHYEELTLGTWAKHTAQYAGNRYGVNARSYLRVIRRKGEETGRGFRNDDLRDVYPTGSELGLFVGIDWRRYSRPDFFNAFYPAPMVFGQQLGMAFQKAFSPHLGISGEAYIGRDPDRKLRIGELAGVSLRLNLPLSPSFRFWLAGNYAKTSATIESSNGSESILSLGLNYNF